MNEAENLETFGRNEIENDQINKLQNYYVFSEEDKQSSIQNQRDNHKSNQYKDKPKGRQQLNLIKQNTQTMTSNKFTTL